jgi:predicted metal-dependent RNase
MRSIADRRRDHHGGIWHGDGRWVLHHLRSAAEGTLARQISTAPMKSRFRASRSGCAPIHTINGFSPHVDQAELLAWRRRADPKRTFLTHGEEAAINALVAILSNG